jgi:hypothetical protein
LHPLLDKLFNLPVAVFSPADWPSSTGLLTDSDLCLGADEGVKAFPGKGFGVVNHPSDSGIGVA